MKKPVIFFGASSILRKNIAISTYHVPELQLEVSYFKNLRPQNELSRFIIRSCDLNVPIHIEIEKTKDDGLSTDLFGASPFFRR